MRIIAGKKRGYKLLAFEGEDVRPTTDRVKESLFNLIQEYVIDASVLDLFCGSGNLSFEALSRGARSAVCIDKDQRSIAMIQKNAEGLQFENQCRIIKASCFDYLENTKDKFDIIFLDPPYNKGLIQPVLEKIFQNQVLSSEGIVVLESDNTDLHEAVNGFEIVKQRKYGRTYITVYQL